MESINAGDVVCLKSDCFEATYKNQMTVEKIDNDIVDCVWFSDDILKRSSFNICVLHRIR